MKTYTFKVKLHYPTKKYSEVLTLTHCPLEVLFNSLKGFSELEKLYKELSNPSNSEVPRFYVTASDYLNEAGEYIYQDYMLCDYKAILDSKSLKDFLVHPDFYDFIEDVSNAQSEYSIISN